MIPVSRPNFIFKNLKMLQIRKTEEQGKPCHYLVDCYNENGRTRERVLFCLGECSTLEEAIEYWSVREMSAKSDISRQQASAAVRTLSEYLAAEVDGASVSDS